LPNLLGTVPNIQSENGNAALIPSATTALRVAAENGCIDVVKELLEKGALTRTPPFKLDEMERENEEL
jgi:ankyrin repeat protein